MSSNILGLVAGIIFSAMTLVAAPAHAAWTDVCPAYKSGEGPTQPSVEMPRPTHKGLVVCNWQMAGNLQHQSSRDFPKKLNDSNVLSTVPSVGVVSFRNISLRPGDVIYYFDGTQMMSVKVASAMAEFDLRVSYTGRFIVAFPESAITDKGMDVAVVSNSCSIPSDSRQVMAKAGVWNRDPDRAAGEAFWSWKLAGSSGSGWNRTWVHFAGCK